MIFALIVFAVLNTIFSLLALANLGRLILASNENMDVLVQAHNFQTGKLTDLHQGLESALDCLLTIDARNFIASGQQAESSLQDGNGR